VRSKIAGGVQPWANAFQALKASEFAALTPEWKARPKASVNCGPYSKPDEGCNEERRDRQAAYAHALMWLFTKDYAHASKAREILNAWAKTNKKHTLANAPLQVAWSAEIFTRAAEIIRHTTPAGFWPASQVKRFEQFLNEAYLPYIEKGRPSRSGGNWELSMADAVINIGVFTNNQVTFGKGISLWKRRVPAYFYLKSDGKLPVKPPGLKSLTSEKLTKFWFGQKQLVNGHSQETCRDLDHTMYGLASAINAAETAKIQGVNLYGLQKKRLIAAHEFHAKYLNGAAVPPSLCNGKGLKFVPVHTFEIAYRQYGQAPKTPMPYTKALLAKSRPTGTNFMMLWETLTHGTYA